MSTLPGLASKGEKSKPKFQSLDINSLYRVSRGENLEKQQQKSTFTYKHGMQSLGKVPNARRAPANLPSLKSEHSGTDASVPLVPPGGPGWGKQESTSSTSTTSSSTTTTTTTSSTPSNQTSPQLTPHQSAIALPVTTTIPPQQSNKLATSSTATPATTTDKSWSSVMSGPDTIHPPLYQSPQFQHEFPSLSVGGENVGGITNTPSNQKTDIQYTPGLSLRPQTEGSWIQGGSRTGTEGNFLPTNKANSVQLGAPPQLAAQVGLQQQQQQQQQLPPQFRAVMPTFMYKGSFATTGTGNATQQNTINGGRNRSLIDNRPPPRLMDPDDITPRPIIKEEELSRMDEIDKDMGWTCHDDIDYNQKLAFSDDESINEKSNKKDKTNQKDKEEKGNDEIQNRNWNRARSTDEELRKQRRQLNKDLELTVQRAKQRKEEEEKRFNEATKQGAAKKLLELEEKMSKRLNREEENVGTINPSVVPPKPIIPTDNIPLPDFQKDKEKDDNNTSFRQLTQIEGKNFSSTQPPRKHIKNDKERDVNFSRHFQNQLPPRFQKQRNHFTNWSKRDSPDLDLDERDYKRSNSDENNYRISSSRFDDDNDWQNIEKKDRPQRPDSRDSRASKDSRQSKDSETLNSSWADTIFEPSNFEEKRIKDERRQVPGPITKERIEADDLKNEKRNLTQLKRGQIPEKKKEDNDEKIEEVNPKAWADSLELKEDTKKCDTEKDDKRSRNRNFSSKSWDYHRTAWPKRQTTSRSKTFHETDSDDEKDSPKNKKDDKNKEIKSHEQKTIKSETKRENYIPRGEPSRHGRGGGNFRNRGGLSKRIDGYGPPPAKSPFGHHDEKKSSDEIEIDIAKQNQQALSAGIIGSSRKEDKTKKKIDIKRNKSKSKDENVDSNSDNSDDKSGRKKAAISRGITSSNPRRNTAPPPRMSNEKKSFSQRNDIIPRQNSSNSLRSQSAIKKDEKIENDLKKDIDLEDSDEKLLSDSDGFQEVKSKKTGKEKLKTDDKTKVTTNKDIKTTERKLKLTQQQISNIPPLMATPINPPPVLPQSNKNQFERPRQSKLAPRFAKQRETNRLQKVQLHQQNFSDVNNDLNKVNQNINVYSSKDLNSVVNNNTTNLTNPWDNKLGTQVRNIDADSVLGGVSNTADGCKSLEHVQTASQRNSPSNDKIIGKSSQLQDKALLDGTTPPVNTIIFENTNFKSAPGSRNTRSENKSRSKLDETIDNSVVSTFNNKQITDLLCKNEKQTDTIQIPLSFKEDNSDIKLDFFESDLSHLTEEKTSVSTSSTSKNLCMSRSIHTITSGNNTISTADALNFKIQSVKKMWETPADHSVGQDDTTFASSFVSDPTGLDPNTAFGKANDNTTDDNHDGYSSSPNQVASNSTTNVCKVKPTQQVSGSGGTSSQVLNSANHQQHSGIMGPSLMGNPLSPPPLQPVIGTGVNLGQPPQYTANQHIGYQAGLGGSNQYSISAIPSPPTVMYNSTQQIQQTGLYGPFQIDQSGVLGGQGRSQYSQYPNHYNLGQTASSPYSTQSVYLQTQPHPPPPPPPTAQAPPDLYQNISNYRLSATGPFGQNQQLNNPTTVLISSTSNSLMSASVKPSSQQISAIGTKAGGVGQAYQQQSQQSQQVYMTYDPALQPNYLPSAGVMQRGPTGPVQNNVVPALQPSSSYYSGSTGQTGYFQQPGSSTIQSAQLQQHQAGYGLQGNVFGTHNQSHTNAGLQSFNSHFLSTPMLAAAINAQQFRSGLPTQYMKSVSNQQIADQTGRSQQLKSPGSQEVLSSVFNSGSQISSPKLRQNCKQPPPQPSPTAQHKYNLYQGVGNQQSGNVMQRYPPPIQRPVNFQQNIGSVQQNNSANQKHRSNNSNNKAPTRQYYQNNSISSQNEKIEESKLNDSTNSSNVNSTVANKTVIGTSSASTVNTSSEITKDAITIEEATPLKD